MGPVTQLCAVELVWIPHVRAEEALLGVAYAASATGRCVFGDGGVPRWERWEHFGSALWWFGGRSGMEVTGPPFYPSMVRAVAARRGESWAGQQMEA